MKLWSTTQYITAIQWRINAPKSAAARLWVTQPGTNEGLVKDWQNEGFAGNFPIDFSDPRFIILTDPSAGTRRFLSPDVDVSHLARILCPSG